MPPLTKEEIMTILQSLSNCKSPGPDGLNGEFFKKTWNAIGKDVTTFIKSLFSRETPPKTINHTTLAPIPKQSNASSPSSFRPINMCNEIYKIFSRRTSSFP